MPTKIPQPPRYPSWPRGFANPHRRVTAARPAAWTPADVPNVGPWFAVAERRSAGRLWQDAGKTVPASADAHPVRVVVTDGGDFTAPDAASRPALTDEGSGKWSLAEAPGAQRLDTPPSAYAGDWTLYAAVVASGSDVVLGGSGTSFLGYTGGGAYAIDDAVNVASATVAAPSGAVVIRARRSGSTVYVRVNAGAELALVGTVAGLLTFARAFEARGTYSAVANRFFAWVPVAGSVGAADDASMTAYLTGLLPGF